LQAMAHPGLPSRAQGLLISPDVRLVAVIAAVICALPRVPGFRRVRHFMLTTPGWSLAMQTAMSLVFVVAVGKAVADPFKPFLYFRF
jgi:alginate O-acetyltransferase complex protein AlgI